MCFYYPKTSIFVLLQHEHLGKVYEIRQKHLGKVYKKQQKYLGKVYEIRQKHLGKVYKANIIFLSNKNL